MLSSAVEARSDAPAEGDDKNSGAVRVVSADGRGRAVEINLAKVTSEQSKDLDKSSTSPRIETATVLEARRYLGFTQDTNASVLANAAKADPGWSAALRAADRLDLVTLGNTVTEVNTLKLQMNPENLGNMVASLRLKGEELTVELQVSSVEAYRHLSADQDDIVKALQDQGFTIDKVTVQLNAAERTDTGTDRDLSRQGQQREDQGGRSDPGRGRDGERSRSGADPENRAPLADDSTAGAGRSGDIYH
jgi:chemotaxis protein MotD